MKTLWLLRERTQIRGTIRTVSCFKKMGHVFTCCGLHIVRMPDITHTGLSGQNFRTELFTTGASVSYMNYWMILASKMCSGNY